MIRVDSNGKRILALSAQFPDGSNAIFIGTRDALKSKIPIFEDFAVRSKNEVIVLNCGDLSPKGEELAFRKDK